MAVHKGRGVSAIEYPTGMNQNGDPSQAWIKIKPDGRVDVFAGTSDSERLQDDPVADRRRDPRDPVRVGHLRQLEHRFLAGLHGHVRLAGHVRCGHGREEGGREGARADPRDRLEQLEIDPADLDIVDGEVIAKGSPQKKIPVPDVAAAATWTYGELLTGTGAQLKEFATIVDPESGASTCRRTRRSRTAAGAAEVEVDDETGEVTVTRLVSCYDVGRAINPTLVEGQIEGGAIQGLGLGVLENCYPYYPSVEHRGRQFGVYLAPGMEDLPQLETLIIENPSSDGPYGAKGIGEMANNPQPPAIASAVYDAVGVGVTELRSRPSGCCGRSRRRRSRAARARAWAFDDELSVNAVGSGSVRFG